MSGFPNNLPASFPSRVEAEEAFKEYEEVQSKKVLVQQGKELPKANALVNPRAKSGRDICLVVLIVVVVMQTYLLYLNQ